MTPILLDAGPLISILCPEEDLDLHRECVQALLSLQHRVPFQTTLPVLTEAMYFLLRTKRKKGMQALWTMINEKGDLLVAYSVPPDLERMQHLMERYWTPGKPMDLADASLVVLAERLGTNEVFTIDRDFTRYRYREDDGFLLHGPIAGKPQ